MSIINSDGLNTNWQLNVLKGLQGTIVELKELNVDTTAIEQTLLDIEATLQNVETNTTGVERTPTLLRASGTVGSIAAGKFSMSFASVGTANATVGGMILKPGETINFDAGALNNTLSALAYDATTVGAELIIIAIA